MGQKSGIHSKARIVIKYLADCQEPENPLQLRTGEGWGLITHMVKEGIKEQYLDKQCVYQI